MAEKLVTETLPGTGTSHQARDVDDLQRGGNQLLRLDVVIEDGQSGIGNRHDTDIGFDGGKGVIGSVSPGCGQRIEESRLAHIGQANDAGFHRVATPLYWIQFAGRPCWIRNPRSVSDDEVSG